MMSAIVCVLNTSLTLDTSLSLSPLFCPKHRADLSKQSETPNLGRIHQCSDFIVFLW